MKQSLNLVMSKLSMAAFSLLAVLALANCALAQQIGYVLNLSGEWFVNGSTRLHEASSLPAGGVIRTNSPSDANSFIVVANREGNIITRRDCRNQGDCNNAIQLPRPKQASVTRTIIDSIFGILSNDLSRYVPVISRGSGPNEAVLKLDDNQIDLSSAFKGMDPGDYFVKFEPVVQGKEAPTNKPLSPIAFKWDQVHPVRLFVNGLGVGMYKLRLVDRQGDTFVDTPTEAWVLVSSLSEFDRVSNAFSKSTKLTEQWGEQVDASIARSFLRASLERLATEQKRENKRSKGKRGYRGH